ncbi:MAG: glycosyltransferase family 1 protein [Candidatus Auribacter fodinae]|jgi:glycosyltransferase involved in cell wall biosynthesis|uniref:Glycosyltransferase family 1 protein n=1 Tax=Candidatus Auribacter fodinae TaxID=2093366 RepID=A0A3A4R0C8_9BACT|nr:MAG: glycosyltransferase family 1 protein [Candidatus Auribacter fodinae]
MTKPAVLHVCNSRVFGGGEEHVRTILKYLKKIDMPVEAAVPQDSPLFHILEREGIVVHHLHIRHKRDFSALKRLCAIVRERNIALIHTHNRQEDLIGALASVITRTPAVTTIHDRINMDQHGQKVRSLGSAVYHFILRRFFKKLICVSHATYDDIIQYARVNPQKCVHIINGLDLDRIQSNAPAKEIRERLGIGKSTAVIGFVARIRGSSFGKKGIMHLLEAMPRIIESRDVLLITAGEDAEATEILKKKCAELGILNHVKFTGYRKDIIDIMHIFDILVCPSLFEGLPRVILETMAMGIPVVGSNVDGIPEVIQDGVSGYLVTPRSSEELALRISELLLDDSKRKQFGCKAQQTINSVYRAELSAEKTAEIYKHICNSL